MTNASRADDRAFGARHIRLAQMRDDALRAARIVTGGKTSRLRCFDRDRRAVGDRAEFVDRRANAAATAPLGEGLALDAIARINAEGT